MKNFKEYTKNFKEYLDSPEGKEYIRKIHWENECEERYINYINKHYGDNIDNLIEILNKKYSSDKYRDREYKLGREPNENLYFLLLKYAAVYGKPCKNVKYLNMFTGEAYYIGSYVIQIMYGQGSVIRIDKIK